MLSDLKIAQQANLENIYAVAQKLNISAEQVYPYGQYIAKIQSSSHQQAATKPTGKLVLVTAIHPTPYGEGKTTLSIGLADALTAQGHKACLALREPSLGPVFGLKGGATGGGYSQIVPMENINLHFTGDLHAITTANNLLVAMVDNHIFQGNTFNINPNAIFLQRCLDINDRQLRHVISGVEGGNNGVLREESFVITAASQIMATFCLSQSLQQLQHNLAQLVVAKSYDGQFITAGMLKAEGALTAVLKDAFMPNLVQTLEGTPCYLHGGPFANIAHGCNSVHATQMALATADIVITEAGFGADLGAEKFLDIKCRKFGIWPHAVVLVATLRALKYMGGAESIDAENMSAIQKGVQNILLHTATLRDVYHLPIVVALNRFASDTQSEVDFFLSQLQNHGLIASVCTSYSEGSKGALDLAEKVCELMEQCPKPTPHYAYDLDDDIKTKILTLAQKVYHAKAVTFSKKSIQKITEYEQQGFKLLPICVAKTPYAFGDNKTIGPLETNFTMHVKDVALNTGSGFVIVYMGDVLTMPGLPKTPNAEHITVNNQGNIEGLF